MSSIFPSFSRSLLVLVAPAFALWFAPVARVSAQDDDSAEAPPIELPEDGTTPNYWVLNFKPEALRMIVPSSGLCKGQVYWYLLYTLENPSSEDREVRLSITASSDRNHTYADLYLPSVERAIEQKEGRALWGKTDEFALQADRDPDDPGYNYMPLKAGEKRKSVAVFNRLDPNANHIVIQIAGLSNEIQRVTAADGSLMLEERVRELTYNRSGDEFTITQDSFDLVEENWVRKELKAERAPAEPAR